MDFGLSKVIKHTLKIQYRSVYKKYLAHQVHGSNNFPIRNYMRENLLLRAGDCKLQPTGQIHLLPFLIWPMS